MKVCERRERGIVDFGVPHRINKVGELKCRLGGELLEEVRKYKYLGSVLFKHRTMEEKVKERFVPGRRVAGCSGEILKGKM